MKAGGSSVSDPEQDPTIVESPLDFPVIGIGASAGGLEALLTFFEHMPSDCGMAFVVILHLSPKHESNAAEILQRATRMTVQQVSADVPIAANHVYVISPSKQLLMSDGHLRVSEAAKQRGRHVAIDLFFRTLAQIQGERAASIILSGTGSDGTIGIRRIKERGGVTLAQSPDDSAYDGMPRSAIGSGLIDIVLPAADMPQRLVDLWRNARNIKLPKESAERPGGTGGDDAEAALSEILKTLRERTGNDFRHYKRATVLRRLERRLQVNGLADLPSYRDFLQATPKETQALLKDMLISVTNFFRDRDVFEAVEREVLPVLLKDRDGNDPLRVWVAGCATGEEAYSHAILLNEYTAGVTRAPDIQVFATDIDQGAIAAGRAAAYPEAIVTDVAPARLRRFFTHEQGQYRLKKGLREKVLFAAHNLLRDPPFSRQDMISCRNLLIYLERDIQMRILEMFHFALKPGGFLLLGSSESADAAGHLFGTVDKRNRIYRRNGRLRGTSPVPSMPLGRSALPAPAPTSTTHTETSFAELHQRSLRDYAPPSVLIDADQHIVHLSERAGQFLRYAGGRPSHDLLATVHPDLRLELRTALFQAAQGGHSVESRRVKLRRDSGERFVNIIVRPLQDIAEGAGCTLVLFMEVETTLSADGAEAGEERDTVVVRQLEEELRRAKEQLQNVLEQSETSTEELRASNEELQAINEELRSATEELETSKEELHSVNEELITVNDELKSKVDEAGKVNDDLQNLIASTEIATLFVDSAMRIKRFTPRAADVFSVIPGDIGRSLLDITNRLEYPELEKDVTSVLDCLRPVEREVRSSEGRWYIARILPYRTIEDRIDGVVLNFVDISRRRGAEEKLRVGEEQMRLIAESASDHAIITLDPDGVITTWSKGAERIFGFTELEAVGRPGEILFTEEDRAQGAATEELSKAARHGRAEDERWHQRKDGSRVYCSGVMTPLREGGPRGYVKIARDLTERKRIDAEKEALLARESAVRAEAQAANALKDEFLAVMSHELKHPLNLIQLSAELLIRAPETRTQSNVARAVDTIRRAVDSQAKIIDDMLDLSRMQTGKLVLNRGATDLSAILASTVAAVADEVRGKGMSIVLESDDSPVLAYADPVRAEQIIWNLISNAIKFSDSGSSITVRLTRDGAWARTAIADTGRGMEPALIEHIFDMFRQGDTGTTRQRGGLGIGLALVRQLTRLHGGRIEARSDGPGQGSTFTVWLPLFEGEGPTAQQPPGIGSFKGLRFLIIDDAADAVTSLEQLLRLEQAEVATAFGGREGLELTAAQDFDLIICDIGMPVVDGYQFIARLRESERNAGTPVIAVSGYSRAEDIARTRAAGFRDHLAKPVTLDALIAAISRIVGYAF